MTWRKHAPSIATLGNLAAGVTACMLATRGRVEAGALMVLAAVLLDSLDGALARTLSAESDFGAELDSLADVVSFGVAPAVLAGSLLPEEFAGMGWLLLLSLPVCAAVRLARFNLSVDRGEHVGFAGLPSTGAGAGAASAILLHYHLHQIGVFGTGALLPWAMLLLAVLMVSRVPYRHAGQIVGRLGPVPLALVTATFILGSALWQYQYLFAALTWGYALAAPLQVAREKIRAVHHA